MKSTEYYDSLPTITLLHRTQNMYNDVKVVTTFNEQVCLSTTFYSSIAP